MNTDLNMIFKYDSCRKIIYLFNKKNLSHKVVRSGKQPIFKTTFFY